MPCFAFRLLKTQSQTQRETSSLLATDIVQETLWRLCWERKRQQSYWSSLKPEPYMLENQLAKNDVLTNPIVTWLFCVKFCDYIWGLVHRGNLIFLFCNSGKKMCQEGHKPLCWNLLLLFCWMIMLSNCLLMLILKPGLLSAIIRNIYICSRKM